MTPSSQTRNRTLAAMPCAPEDREARVRYAHPYGGGYVESAKKAARTEAVQHLAAVDPSCAYGCVDWFIYPDPKASLAVP